MKQIAILLILTFVTGFAPAAVAAPAAKDR
jgi:hypothetical protein